MKKDSGSVLIVSLWALSVFSVLLASLSFQGGEHAQLMKREVMNFQTKNDFLSALNLAAQRILSDPRPHEDFPEEDGYGRIQLPEPWKEKFSLQMEDEESKLNLNSASRTFLESFLKLFEEKKDSLKGERKDFVRRTLQRREKDRILSLEELYLLEGIEKEDVERLRPFISVYPELPQLNINTTSFLVLEALLNSFSGDDSAKKEILRKLAEFRKMPGETHFFTAPDLEPHSFIGRLALTRSPQMVSLVNLLLPLVTADSRTYQLKIQTKSGKEARAVIRERGEGRGIEVLSWREDWSLTHENKTHPGT